MFSWETQALNYSSSSHDFTISLHGQFWVFPKDTGKTWLPLKMDGFGRRPGAICEGFFRNWPIPISFELPGDAMGTSERTVASQRLGLEPWVDPLWSWSPQREPEHDGGRDEKATTKNSKNPGLFNEAPWDFEGFSAIDLIRTGAGYDYNNPGFLGLLPRRWVEGVTAIAQCCWRHTNCQ